MLQKHSALRCSANRFVASLGVASMPTITAQYSTAISQMARAQKFLRIVNSFAMAPKADLRPQSRYDVAGKEGGALQITPPLAFGYRAAARRRGRVSRLDAGMKAAASSLSGSSGSGQIDATVYQMMS